ncbi:DNA-binding transcriptional LysR family regulator [Ectopseudomonas oleovorans]|uniref:DNA-binding transcriptional LysR family regulator n=2 Tax=Pseudomonadaceae TaxID=135621 RepID=A0A397NT35_ECTOL|nr:MULTISPECIES: LysR family transcriptional regulator [Pseudomonas]QMV65319.1 LysR family transcriptional regulator [Pseudomonas berkeleyensis]RIA36581.1 DNA-binding transcriptional LysR family regulator [Pseudomonas oleovorans]WSO40797.1 LysR family transcriptional regulator [Pseudomonas berkeleyensis]
MRGNLSDVDLRMLRTFCAIVEAGGFTAAQARLNISLPRLSVIVRDLEVRLGYSLCKRGKSGFQLTEQGQQTYAAAQELFASVSHFQDRTTSLSQRPRETLLIGAVDALASFEAFPLVRAITALRKVTPETGIELHIMRPDELEQAVLDERLELAVGAFHHHLSGLNYTPLCRERNVLYCSDAHPFFAMKDERLSVDILSEAVYVDRGYLSESRRPHQLRFQHFVNAYTMEATALLIFSGTYIGYLPTHYAQPWVDRGRLRPIRPDSLSFEAQFECIVRQGLEQKPAVSRLQELLLA